MNEINTFFADIATDNSYDISGPIKFDWDSAADHDSYSHPNSLEPFTTHAVRHYLSKLKKTASGFDGLPYWFFKNFPDHLSDILTTMFNRVLHTCTVPLKWKHAIVTPIPKNQ